VKLLLIGGTVAVGVVFAFPISHSPTSLQSMHDLWAIPVFAGGADRQLAHFSADGIWGGCSYSSDGKHIAIARGPQTSDVVLFSNAN
jgi:hypothetical protein